MRSSDPHSTGTAESSSTWVSDQPCGVCRCFASGVTSPQDVKQIVKAIVASARLREAKALGAGTVIMAPWTLSTQLLDVSLNVTSAITRNLSAETPQRSV